MANYRKRIADDILDYKLSAMGTVLVEGAKWCGHLAQAQVADQIQRHEGAEVHNGAYGNGIICP